MSRGHEKDFDVWNEQKKRIDAASHTAPLFNEREVWWCTFGENVGTEVCGKNEYFRRPVLIVKKLARTSFIGVPLSTQQKEGTWYVDVIHSDGARNSINLAQIRYFDYRRLDKRMSTLGMHEFTRVQSQLRNLLGLQT